MSADSLVDHRQYPGLHETILRAAGAGVLVIDLSGAIREASSEAAAVLGLDPAVLARKQIHELLPATRVAEWQEAVQSSFHDGQQRSFIEKCGVRQCRITLNPVVHQGRRITHAVIAIHDITEQWASEIRYRELFRRMGRGTLICESPDDGLTFTVKDVNSWALAFCAASQDDAVGKTVSEALPNVEKSGLLATMRRVYTSSVEERTSFFLEDDAGRGLWLDTSVLTLPNRELIVIFDDIGGIAHDFINILSAIIGYGLIAKGKLERASPVQEDIDQILADGDRAVGLVKRILTSARRETSDRLQPLRRQFIFPPVLAQESLSPSEAPSAEYAGNERIMVIDDDPSVGLVHEKTLTKLGYRVVLYNDSLEAVRKFHENPNCCDLVLTDMTMPNMTGTELAREMLSLRPDLPIILVTGRSEMVDKERAFRIGIRDFLLKPVKKAELSIRVKEVLQEWRKFS